ncbi:MAG: hypothetical protein DCC67_15440 [Planctomycetota bacterium]|nr:MAG: hypothetical protein DCC67_15440 [Planctomycetota bacterium]
MGRWLIAAAVAAVIVVLLAIWRRRRAARLATHRREAMREFDDNRSLLAAEFFHAAATSGKPRGLRWTSCDLAGQPLFAVDEKTGILYALVAATVGFEAVAGGGMEEVEAVGNLRSATAVFMHLGDQWSTEGRVVFNLEPHEAVKHFHATLQPVER